MSAEETNLNPPPQTTVADLTEEASPSVADLTEPAIPAPAPSAVPDPALYDAAAEQVIPFEIEHGGFKYPITVAFRATGDMDFIEYDRLRQLKLQGVDDGTNVRSDVFDASLDLFKRTCTGVTGWGPEDGSKLQPKYRVAAIQTGLLAFEIMPPKVLSADEAAERRPWEDDADNEATVIRLRARFGDQVIVTEHSMNAPTPDHTKRFTALMSRSKLTAGEKLGQQETAIQSRMRPLGKLYDEMLASVKGYVNNNIPLPHKQEIIIKHMTPQMEALEKN